MENNKKIEDQVSEEQVTEQQISQWKAKHREVISLLEEDTNETYYFKKPGHNELSRFTQAAMKDALKGMKSLVRDCLLHPSLSVVEQIAADRPGIYIALGGELQKVAGTNTDFFVKRL
jgi:membrane-bound lytic murein transglycosylase